MTMWQNDRQPDERERQTPPDSAAPQPGETRADDASNDAVDYAAFRRREPEAAPADEPTTAVPVTPPAAAQTTPAGQPGARMAQQSTQPPSTLQRTSAEVPATAKSSIGALAKDVSPSVVMVLTRDTAAPGLRQGTQGEGTGFIVDESGLILTNNHVIEGAQRITIVFGDNSRTTATVVGRDPQSDLAVLKAEIPADKLVVAPLGDSDLVETGEPVVAIGAPFGLNGTVTSGIVSATKRDWGQTQGGRPMRGLIQTDAPVNPGNSGGPLFNMNGEVIGITTAIESPVRGSVGIGFAIPINQAKKLLPQLSTGQNVQHPWLGISGIAITEDVAAEQQLPVKEGVLVAETVSDGPAEKAGVRGGRETEEGAIPAGGDIITAVDGKMVKTVQEISRYLDTLKVGDKVKLSVLRDGKAQDITVTLGAWQRPPEQPSEFPGLLPAPGR